MPTTDSIVGMKTCSKCAVEKSLDEFHKHTASPDGLQYSCKECRHQVRVSKWEESSTQEVVRVRNGITQTYTRGKNHGESKTPLYRRWKAMRERCNSTSAHNYRWYGGRGVTVCKEWDTNFFAFKTWALDNGYSRDMELDRINNDGSYSPENCRWVTKLTNLENRAAYLSPEMEDKVIARAEQDGISIHTVIKNALESYL